MAPVLKVLDILRVIRIAKELAREHIKRFPGRAASILAFLGRRLKRWCHFWLEIFGRPKPAERRFIGSEARSYSVLGGPATSTAGEYVVAASYVPASATASHPTLHEHTESPTGTVSPPGPVASSIAIKHPHTANPPHAPGGGNPVNRSSGNLSAVVGIQSRASDGYSITTNSHESIRAPLDQPSRLRRATYPQFGCGLDQLRSSERATWPPIPTTRPHTVTHHPSRLEFITALPSTHDDGKVDPVVQPLAPASYTHEPLSPPPMNELRRRRSSTSVVVNVQYPTTEPLPISFSTNPRSPTSSIHPTLDYFLPEGRFVKLINSDQIPRYTKNARIPRVKTVYDVKALTTEFPYFPEPNGSEQDSLQQDCSPWIPATHPDGALYFYDEERRLFTDTDMHDKRMRDEIEDFYNYLQRVIHIDQLSIPSKSYDLVLDITVFDEEPEKRIMWSYYYVCHEARCLFWLETYDASNMISELFGVKSPAHVKHRLESLYWNHWSLYPVVFGDRCLPHDAYDELMGILMHGCVDVLTSKSSTLPYDGDTMGGMIRLVQGAKDAKGGLAYHTAGITCLLSVFAHWRFLHFHGQRHARLISYQSVYDKPNHERSLFILVLSSLLFLAPRDHLSEIGRLWTDGIVVERVWKSVMSNLVQDWERVILWSTVTLSANVGFLAIPGIVPSSPSDTITSPSQVDVSTLEASLASSLSVLTSIGSIVIGLLLVHYNRTKQNEDPAGASTYLHRISHVKFGLQPMAIVFSLPWALLMWSMVTFLIALLIFCFSISVIFTIFILVGIMAALLPALTVWRFRVARGRSGDDDVRKNSLVVSPRQRTYGTLFGWLKDLNPFHTRRVPLDDRISLNSRLGEGRV